MNPFKLRFLRRGTTPTPTPTPSSSIPILYDTSIGLSVDTTGRADLTPRVGASIFYVNDSTGSDLSATPTNPATPVKTVKKAVSFVTDEAGDHVLVAQGMSYTNGLAYIGDKGGFSPLYPFVIQSYDPADPTNQAKWGAATGSNRPIVNIFGADMGGGFIQGSGTSKKYRAFRGLEFNGGNAANSVINIFTNTTGTPDYMLWENNVHRYSGVGFNMDGGAVPTKHIIFRNSSLPGGAWSTDPSSSGASQQGLFFSNTDGFTIEYCALWHNGWNTAVTRATTTAGGPSIFNHPIYAQDNNWNTIGRGNVSIDGSADGGNFKGGGLVYNCLLINNPQATAIGGGNFYATVRPNGIDFELAYNFSIGGGGVNTSPQDWGTHVNGGSPGSSVHHNVYAHSSSGNGPALLIDAPRDSSSNIIPSYCSFHDNVGYQWSAAGNSIWSGLSGTAGPDTSYLHGTYSNNFLDDVTSGTNTNSGSVSFANPYTLTSLLSALGYADLTTAIAAFTNYPEQRGWINGPALGLAGYNLSLDTTIPTLSTVTTTSITTTTATVGVTAAKAGGVLHCVLSTSSSAPTEKQVRGSKDSGGNPVTTYMRQMVLNTGAQSLAFTGLITATTYYRYFVQEDSCGNVSAVLSGGSFTTS